MDKREFKKKEVHVQIYASNKLAGYTALRLRNLIVNKKRIFFLF
tara:strand:+ start:1199 stop:1330 length:132 start_codon:yes stop_codon:yes gene_type:complete